MAQINPTYLEGQGDAGVTAGLHQAFVTKDDPVCDFYNDLEFWNWNLNLIYNQMEAIRSQYEIDAYRFNFFLYLLRYLRDHSYVLGSFIYFMNDPEKAQKWRFDHYCLTRLDQELAELKTETHNFIVVNPDPGLDCLRIQTRKLEQSFWGALNTLIEDGNSGSENLEALLQAGGWTNAQILNRLSDYFYHFSVSIMMAGEDGVIDAYDWDMIPQPDFKPPEK